LRLLFAEHGVHVKKARIGEQRQRIQKIEKTETVKKIENNTLPETKKIQRKKRRRKKSSTTGENHTSE